MLIMKRFKLKVAFWVIITSVVLYACSKSKDAAGPSSAVNDDFKITMLTNYADNIIIPAYIDLQAKFNALDNDVNAFLQAPADGTQSTLKASFKNAYISYEAISAAYFGPASVLLLNNYLNTFPTSTTKIE